MGKKLNLCFLWHMHQPPYEDPRTGMFLLPWTFLHSIKDYYDMAEVVSHHPGIKVVFNVTPCLLLQIQQYVDNTVWDQTLLMLWEDSEKLTPAHREFLLRIGFAINPATMIVRFPRYRELYDIYTTSVALEEAEERFSYQDFLDLSVLFVLAWCGQTLMKMPEISYLIRKGRDFTPEEKDMLLKTTVKFMERIIPKWREMASLGNIEFSTSPFYHPLMPLLYSNDCALEANPQTHLPKVRLSAPDEVERQLELGLSYFEKVFGFKSQGMWPPEGGVSDPIVAAIGSKGVQWIATDEEILRRSLGSSFSFQNRLIPRNRHGVTLFFRDRVLSDNIGFVYSKWPITASTSHFLDTLKGYAEQVNDERAIVLVALDGENAWEYYHDGGYPFLESLYKGIEESDFIRTVTLSEYIEMFGKGESIGYISAGSWIGGNFDTWIGDPVKNRAWSFLAAAHQVLRDVPISGECKVESTANGSNNIRCHLLRAEASDFFWWFGKGHSSINDREFDYLFRENLKAIYEKMQLPHPDYLDRPLEAEHFELQVTQPVSYINPPITGKRETFYKWVGSGHCEFSHGSIHRLEPIISSVDFGYSKSEFFVCINGFNPLHDFFSTGGIMDLRIIRPMEGRILVSCADGKCKIEFMKNRKRSAVIQGARAAVQDVFEMAVPSQFFEKAFINQSEPIIVEFYIVLWSGGLEVERFPWDSLIRMEYYPETLEIRNWIV